MAIINMKKNVLIISNVILHYRISFFNALANNYDVTVLHSGKSSVKKEDNFREIIVPLVKVGPFRFQKFLFQEVKKQKYDVVIAMFDVAWINTLFLLYKYNKKIKFILWGAWITNNYVANCIRIFLAKKVSACVFYTNEAKIDFIKRGVPSTTLYVANNTFDVSNRVQSYNYPKKWRVLFVGSLDKRKQNDVLFDSFRHIINKIPSDIILTMVGDGFERNQLVESSVELGLNNRIEFVGTVNDTEILKKYYEEAIVSVSFGQAGLSVLQSIGYGVPFLTKENAISGGEISNIKNGYNGILCKDSETSLSDNLILLCNNIDYSRELGKNAYDYYSKYCTMENMVQGFKDAIEGTRYTKIDEN
jgi:glycosyltransferase involved in cell wall biosynthesis